MTFGTPNDDTISGNGAIFGLAGNDSLSTTNQNGVLDGGTGNDTLDASFVSTTVPFFPTTQHILNGGSGDDSLTATLNVDDNTTSRHYAPVITAIGGAGNDEISIGQSINLGLSASPSSYISGTQTPTITVIDQSGNNTINVTADNFSNDNAVDSQMTVVTGNGSDSVSTSFSGDANNYTVGNTQTIQLGGGHDQLDLFQSSGYGSLIIDAGGGHDDVSLTYSGNSGNEGGNGIDIALDAGFGNDTVVANINEVYNDGGIYSQGNFDLGGGADHFTLNANFGNNYDVDLGAGRNVARITVDSDNIIFPGTNTINVVGAHGGNDISIDLLNVFSENLDTSVNTGSGRDVVAINGTSSNTVSTGSNADEIKVSSKGFQSINTIDGGNGHDTITVDASDAANVTSTTQIYGGLGNDVIVSTHNSTGTHNIKGGSGNDEITMTGGLGTALGEAGNDTITGSAGDDTIDGGNAKDVLEGGLGDDKLIGGLEVDTFVFSASIDEGQDTITDWSVAEDILNITGITDTGAAGLADDIDAISTITDNGTDVILSLNTGTDITFLGVGTGSITSVADLVNDPLNQLA